MEKREPLYTVGDNANWYTYYGKQYIVFSEKLNYDPAIPLLGIYLKKMKH